MGNRGAVWLLAAWLPAAWAVAEDIRDIRGPATTAGAPPYSLTLLILVLAGGALVYAKARRTRPQGVVVSEESATTLREQLMVLMRDHDKGACSIALLFDRLDALLRLGMARGDARRASIVTLAELAAAAEPPLRDSELSALAIVLPVLERARYAAFQPAGGEIGRVLEAAMVLIEREAGDS